MPVAVLAAPFVGRQRELAVLQRRLAQAAAGAGGLILVAGDPGIGKTRLVDEAAAHASAEGWRVLLGRAFASEGMPPYLPFAEALRGYARATSPEVLRAQLGAGAADVALLVRELRMPEAAHQQALSPEYQRYQLFESVCDFLLAIASDAPSGLLLVLDDLHWADRSTLLLLEHLARRLDGARLLIAATYRTVELGPAHPLAAVLAELSRERRAERILLAPLSEREASALITGMIGREAAAAVTGAILREVEGNPFFLEEVVRHLQADGRDLADDGAVIDHWSLPESVRQVIGSRIARLSDAAGRLLQAGAVLGDQLTFEVLSITSGIEADRLLDALDEVLHAGLLREHGGGYQFSHALIRQTVYDALSLARKQRLHLGAAEAIEQVYLHSAAARLASLASHYRLAGAAADAAKAVEYTRRAGETAQASFAWEEAAGHYSVALELLGDGEPSMRFRLLLALGEAQRQAGLTAAARVTLRRAVDVARTLQDAALFAGAVLRLGEVWTETGAPDQSLAALAEAALAGLPEADGALRAQLLGRLARLRTAEDTTAGLALSQLALDMARRVGDPAALADVLYARLWTLSGAEHVADRLAVAAENIHLAAAIGDRALSLRGHAWRITSLLERGAGAEVQLELELYTTLAEELRQPLYRWRAYVMRAALELLHGRFGPAEQIARQALELGQRLAVPDAAQAYGAFQFVLCWDRGRLVTLESDLYAFVDQYPAIPAWRAALALLLIELDRPAAARSQLERLIAAGLDRLPHNQNWLSTITTAAEVAAYLNDTTVAAVLYRLLRPYAQLSVTLAGAVAYEGPVARHLGLLAAALGRWSDAVPHFEAAIALAEQTDAPSWAARAQASFGFALLQRNSAPERDRGQALLDRALLTARELGLARLVEQIERRSSTLPGTPPIIAFPDGLTAREVEVLRLLAKGQTNREIAGTLVLSPRTVERHVASAYRKANVHRRADAATYALHKHLISTDG